MKRHELKISYAEFENESELNESDRELLQKARVAAESAYAPYSNFYVGAALLLKNGQIITGNNQENVAYPSGLCAERVAIYAAGATFPDEAIETIAVTCKSPAFEVNEPLSPCGACRQAIAEYEMRHNSKIRILLAGEKGRIRMVESISDLLPFMFKAEELKKG
ncbi:MAG: cdd [Bacteroidetes bacterium]|nr:cdd [Bacteroidota bacterium]